MFVQETVFIHVNGKTGKFYCNGSEVAQSRMNFKVISARLSLDPGNKDQKIKPYESLVLQIVGQDGTNAIFKVGNVHSILGSNFVKFACNAKSPYLQVAVKKDGDFANMLVGYFADENYTNPVYCKARYKTDGDIQYYDANQGDENGEFPILDPGAILNEWFDLVGVPFLDSREADAVAQKAKK